MHRTLIGALAAFALAVAACGSGTDTAIDPGTIDFDAVAPTTESTDVPIPDEGAVDRSAADAAPEPPAATVASTSPGVDVLKTQTLGSGILAKTVEPSEEVSSARFMGTFTFVGTPESDTPGEVSLTFSGAYDLPNDASQVSMDFGDIAAMAGESSDDMAMFEAFFAEPLEIITIGDKAWIKWGFLSLFGAGDGVWLETEADESDGFTADFGFGGSGSPTELLDLLSEASARTTPRRPNCTTQPGCTPSGPHTPSPVRSISRSTSGRGIRTCTSSGRPSRWPNASTTTASRSPSMRSGASGTSSE